MSKRYRPFFVVAVSQTFGLLLMLVVATATGGGMSRPTTFPGRWWPSITGSWDWHVLSRDGTGAVGVVSPITALAGLGPIVLGLALGTPPTVVQYLGLLAALLGVVLPADRNPSGDMGPDRWSLWVPPCSSVYVWWPSPWGPAVRR